MSGCVFANFALCFFEPLLLHTASHWVRQLLVGASEVRNQDERITQDVGDTVKVDVAL